MTLKIDKFKISEDFELLIWHIQNGILVHFTDWELEGDYLLLLHFTRSDSRQIVMFINDTDTIQSFKNEKGKQSDVGEILREKYRTKTEWELQNSS